MARIRSDILLLSDSTIKAIRSSWYNK